jgi:hypothetical protein
VDMPTATVDRLKGRRRDLGHPKIQGSSATDKESRARAQGPWWVGLEPPGSGTPGAVGNRCLLRSRTYIEETFPSVLGGSVSL